MSLRTGTTLITLLNTINKVSGLYGILALLTGFSLSSLQLSMYLYSLIALALLVYLSPHIRQASPLQNLLLAYFYLLDSVINMLYTAFFSLAWFTVLSSPSAAGNVPGGSTIDSSSGFTSPEHNVSHVDVSPGTGAVVGHNDAKSTSTNGGQGQGHVTTTFLQPGTMASVSVILGLWAIRVYFILIVFAYARLCVRQAVATQSATGLTQLAAPSTSDGNELAENPFSASKELGAGWRGRLGRTLTSFGSRFWLGKEEEGEWVRMELGDRGGKKRGRKQGQGGDGVEAGTGTNERERRRRAGTGPSKPGVGLQVDVPKK